MVRISAETIEAICTKNGKFYVPDRIKTAIEGCLESDDENSITAEYERLFEKFQEYETINAPIEIEYGHAVTLDAYLSYYFARNFFIPMIGLRDLTYNSLFQNVPDSINVLDMGSGTGAIVFGLLWMFSNSPLPKIPISISALDSCEEALDRQKCMLSDAGFGVDKVTHYVADIKDANSCIKALKGESPFDFIFVANCLTEIPFQNGLDLIERFPEILADNGAIIIAEAQRNYTKALVRSIAAKAPGWGLQVYYPCPGGTCPYTFPYNRYCMTWRYHEYEVPDIKVKDSPLSGDTKDKLTASWLILTKQNVSIYDSLKREGQDLEWGPISKAYSKYRSICSGGHVIDLSDDGLFSRYKRGHIVGLSNEHEVVEHYAL